MYAIGLPSTDATVLELKEAIYQREDVPPQDNMLKFQGKLLDNDSTKLSDYKIQNEDAVLSILVAKR